VDVSVLSVDAIVLHNTAQQTEKNLGLSKIFYTKKDKGNFYYKTSSVTAT